MRFENRYPNLDKRQRLSRWLCRPEPGSTGARRSAPHGPSTVDDGGKVSDPGTIWPGTIWDAALRRLERRSPLSEADRRAIRTLPHTVRRLAAGAHIVRDGDKAEH